MKITKESALKIIAPLLQRSPMNEAEACGARVALDWINERLDLADAHEAEKAKAAVQSSE